VSFVVTSPSGTPTGRVTVSDGVDSCTGDLDRGSGSCSLALSTSGDRTLVATYEGSPAYTSSSSSEQHSVTSISEVTIK
jgi:hypothetical protein